MKMKLISRDKITEKRPNRIKKLIEKRRDEVEIRQLT